ncbi:hypothetical protein TNCT_572461, partial [Trichonephila clavata]
LHYLAPNFSADSACMHAENTGSCPIVEVEYHRVWSVLERMTILRFDCMEIIIYGDITDS